MSKVLLIGCGHMGSALLNSWMGIKSYSFAVIDPHNFRNLKNKFYNNNVKIFDQTPTQKQIKKFDIIIFAIKPQLSKQVLSEYRDFEFKKNSFIGSIIAGKKINFFKKNIRNSQQIVRIMPNMPALIAQGVSCYIPNKYLSKNNEKKIEILFSRVGKIIKLKNENQIDMATAVSGSGPGYIFTLIDALEKASCKIGFSKSVSRELILSTILGSVELMKKTNEEADKLANSIAVKGGTTEAGLKVLQKNNIHRIIHNTFLAAYKRASKLGKK